MCISASGNVFQVYLHVSWKCMYGIIHMNIVCDSKRFGDYPHSSEKFINLFSLVLLHSAWGLIFFICVNQNNLLQQSGKNLKCLLIVDWVNYDRPIQWIYTFENRKNNIFMENHGKITTIKGEKSQVQNILDNILLSVGRRGNKIVSLYLLKLA